MSNQNIQHMIYLNDSIRTIIESFIIERKSQNLSHNTILYYARETGYFHQWLDKQHIQTINEITPDIIREYLSDLGTHRNKGGVHANYRAIKALFNFYEFEYEPENWKNPIRKVKIQNNKIDPLPGISIESVERLIKACNGRNMIRDKAILHCLVSSGCRANEFLALNLQDIDLTDGTVKILHGKGGKKRTTYFGKDARKALRRYLMRRTDIQPDSPLWLNENGERMTISGLRHMVHKYAKQINLNPPPGLHDFRRCFAITLYRKGVEILLISTLLGHSSVEVTKRYLNLDDDDLRKAHMKGQVQQIV